MNITQNRDPRVPFDINYSQSLVKSNFKLSSCVHSQNNKLMGQLIGNRYELLRFLEIGMQTTPLMEESAQWKQKIRWVNQRIKIGLKHSQLSKRQRNRALELDYLRKKNNLNGERAHTQESIQSSRVPKFTFGDASLERSMLYDQSISYTANTNTRSKENYVPPPSTTKPLPSKRISNKLLWNHEKTQQLNRSSFDEQSNTTNLTTLVNQISLNNSPKRQRNLRELKFQRSNFNRLQYQNISQLIQTNSNLRSNSPSVLIDNNLITEQSLNVNSIGNVSNRVTIDKINVSYLECHNNPFQTLSLQERLKSFKNKLISTNFEKKFRQRLALMNSTQRSSIEASPKNQNNMPNKFIVFRNRKNSEFKRQLQTSHVMTREYNNTDIQAAQTFRNKQAHTRVPSRFQNNKILDLDDDEPAQEQSTFLTQAQSNQNLQRNLQFLQERQKEKSKKYDEYQRQRDQRNKEIDEQLNRESSTLKLINQLLDSSQYIVPKVGEMNKKESHIALNDQLDKSNSANLSSNATPNKGLPVNVDEEFFQRVQLLKNSAGTNNIPLKAKQYYKQEGMLEKLLVLDRLDKNLHMKIEAQQIFPQNKQDSQLESIYNVSTIEHNRRQKQGKKLTRFKVI
ncbi:UNKNOWN [Stylonychia lemnae]|uniref:Uncharacterized protein n=1 Tax=Stylonychia lemnae TaxID=5949 RepID=A0A078AFT8_STYLE|nr:UNKNOWN [Stylonychia lemnae]|eukprot:CDW80701.1 UNKNOWN [Stylonychia lemnae]